MKNLIRTNSTRKIIKKKIDLNEIKLRSFKPTNIFGFHVWFVNEFNLFPRWILAGMVIKQNKPSDHYVRIRKFVRLVPDTATADRLRIWGNWTATVTRQYIVNTMRYFIACRCINENRVYTCTFDRLSLGDKS